MEVKKDFNLMVHISLTFGNLYYDYVILFSKSEKRNFNKETHTAPKVFTKMWHLLIYC